MERQKLIILPKIHDYNGDTSKDWCINYSYRNVKTNRMVRFQIRKGLTGDNTAEQRYTNANVIIDELTEKLKGGWNPFTDDSTVIYDDQLLYSHIAEEQGRLRQSNKTFNYYFSLYLTENLPNISPATFTTYKSKLRLFEIWINKKYIESFDVSEFSESMAKEFVKHLVNDRKVKNNTVRHYLTLLRAVFDWMIEKKAVRANYFLKIKIKKEATVSAKYFNDGILQKMKVVITENDPQLWLAALFQYYCFIRPKELRLLKIENLDFDNNCIQIPGSISKNRKTQTVIIPEVFRQYLYLLNVHKANPNHYIITIDGVPGPEPVCRNYIYQHFVKIRELMNLPMDYKLYSFKHTGAVKASKVIPIKDLQLQLRHHSLDMVDRYLKQMLGTDSLEVRNLFPAI